MKTIGQKALKIVKIESLNDKEFILHFSDEGYAVITGNELGEQYRSRKLAAPPEDEG